MTTSMRTLVVLCITAATLSIAPAAHAAVVTDTFTGADGTALEDHVGEVGASWTWHANYPAYLRLQSGRVWGPEWGLYFASGIPSTAEYDVTTDLHVKSNSGAIGVVARSSTSGTDSLYMGRYNAAGARWELVKCTTSCTVLDSFAQTLVIGATYAIKLEVRNASKKLYVGGVERASSTDNTITQIGRAGIRSGPGLASATTGYHLDNFNVNPPPAPQTNITAGPSGATNNAGPSFSFTSTPSGGTFTCKLDGPGATVGTWGTCTSPKAYSALAQGSYTFSVRATVAGVTDPTPATRAFTVDTTAPQTTIDSGPSGTITTNSASFGFSSEAGTTFECKLDGPGTVTGTYGACTSPKAYSSLANGSYTFSVQARDAAGNQDASPATRAFTVAVPGCSLNLGALDVNGCTLVKSDTGASADPIPLWGKIECEVDARHQHVTTGGDPHPTGDGSAQGNTSLRRTNVFDGDDFYGERCELGRNEHRTGFTPETFNLYREGQRRITFLSLRLPSNFPLSTTTWQVVMQMKQTQPSDNGTGTPVLAMEAKSGRWRVVQSDSVLLTSGGVELWNTPAATGVWTRFAFDVTYSQYSSQGSLKVYVDLNGDGDSLDSGEQSPTFTTYTLKREIAAAESPDNDPLVEGASIPSHLRAGIYHNPTIACPSPAGCATELDNVQIYAVP